MTEYRIGTRNLWVSYLGTVLMTFLFIGSIVGISQAGAELFFIFIYVVFLTIFIYVLVVLETIYDRRKNFALKGHKTTAVIKTVEVKRCKSPYCFVYYKYMDEYKEECIGKTPIELGDMKFFQEGNAIPVYLNGQFAAFNVEEIRNIKNTYTSPKKEEVKDNVRKKVVCDYCDSLYDINLDQCPNCGASKNKSFINL